MGERGFRGSRPLWWKSLSFSPGPTKTHNSGSLRLVANSATATSRSVGRSIDPVPRLLQLSSVSRSEQTCCYIPKVVQRVPRTHPCSPCRVVQTITTSTHTSFFFVALFRFRIALKFTQVASPRPCSRFALCTIFCRAVPSHHLVRNRFVLWGVVFPRDFFLGLVLRTISCFPTRPLRFQQTFVVLTFFFSFRRNSEQDLRLGVCLVSQNPMSAFMCFFA